MSGCHGLKYPSAKKPNFLFTSNGPETIGSANAVNGMTYSLIYSWNVSQCASLPPSQKADQTYTIKRHGGTLQKRDVFKRNVPATASIRGALVTLNSGTKIDVNTKKVTLLSGNDRLQDDGSVLQEDGTIVGTDGKAWGLVEEQYIQPNGITTEVRTCNHSSIRNVTPADAAFRLMEAGFLLSDQVCGAYFSRIGNENQDMSYFRRTLNTVSTVVASILGITESDAKSISIVSALFSQTEAGFENFSETYHFTPHFESVHDLVKREQDVVRKQMADPEKIPTRHSEAVSAIQVYQDICQLKTIQSAVDEAIQAATPKLPEDDSTAAEQSPPATPSAEMINKLLEDIDEEAIAPLALELYSRAALGGISSDQLDNLKIALNAAGLKVENGLKLNEVRTWLETVQKNQPDAYAALVERAKALDLAVALVASPEVTAEDLPNESGNTPIQLEIDVEAAQPTNKIRPRPSKPVF